MDIFECIFNRRSCRRFRQDAVSMEHLEKMVDAGRYAPTGFNHQNIRFAVVASPEKVAEAFKMTGWLTGRPPEGQRPVAYIAVMGKDAAGVNCATYAVMLAAHALGYGSCWHGFAAAGKIETLTGLDGEPRPGVLISLGRPDESYAVTDPAGPEELKVEMDEEGTVRLGKLGREHSLLAVV